MKHALLRWSRLLHKWIGVYICILTLIWLLEMPLLPLFYAPTEALTPQTGHSAIADGEAVNLTELLTRIKAGEYGMSVDAAEISFTPASEAFTLRDREHFTWLRLDAHTGNILERGVDSDALFAERSALGWVHPVLRQIITIPFEVSFVLLALTGAHLVLYPYFKKSKPAAQDSLLGLQAGDSFLFRATKDLAQMGRMAALGLLPGVLVKILRMPARGPLVLSVRHTRIAVGRSIADTFAIDKERP
ncbi:MAG: FeoA family protein [Desulfocurvibacter africanus]